MSLSRPPRILRAFLILGRMALLQRLARWNAKKIRKAALRQKPESARREAIPRKSPGRSGLLVLMALMALQFTLITTLTIDQLARHLSDPPVSAVEAPDQDPAPAASPLLGPGASISENPRDPRIVLAMALLVFLLSSSVLALNLGQGSQDLGHVGREMEWLFTFPVSRRALLLARLCALGPGNPNYWLAFLPALMVIHAKAGPCRIGLLLAPFFVLCLTVILGAMHLWAESWARKKLRPNRLRNLQALFQVLGAAGLFGLLALTMVHRSHGFLLGFGIEAGSLLLWTPPGLAVVACFGSQAAWIALAGMGAWALAGAGAALFLSGRLIHDGLIAETGGPQGKRSRGPVEARPSLWPPGIVGKDLRLLLRDRNLLVQVFGLPLLLLAFNLFNLSGLKTSLLASSEAVATLAFLSGAYPLLLCAPRSLCLEGKALWLLFTMPWSFARVLFLKAFLMGLVFSPIPLAILGAGWHFLDVPLPAYLLEGLLALGGVWIFAFIATGLGALGIDYLEQGDNRQMRAWSSLFLMLLASMYVYALHAPGLWPKLATACLFAMLVLAVCQNVREQAPFLLDPDACPPPLVSLTDGLAALLAFSILQGLISSAFLISGVELGPSLTLGFFLAGGAVFAGSLALFRLRLPWPVLAVRLGMRRGSENPQVRLRGPLGESLLWGVLALLGGLAYLWVLRTWPPAGGLREGLFDLASATGSMKNWLLLLGLLGAPLFEEYLFRGILYKGLRRTWRPLPSMLASAALFAAVHPPVSMLPVFGLGLCAALAFERTKLLLAPILVHALYNAGVMGVQLPW